MAFETQEVEEHRFDSLTDLKKHLSNEKNRFCMIPINDFVDKKATFFEDEYFGDDKDYVRFNEDGFRSFCQRFQLPVAFLHNLPEHNLASKAINNYFSKDKAKQKLERYSFVLDEEHKTVVGVVGIGYVGFSNETFLTVIEQVLPDGFSSYEFRECYWINTRLHLRVLSKEIKAGEITGEGGTDKDISKIGIEFRNSLVGNSPVRISYFIFRLLCANGLIHSGSKNTGAVYHRGKTETFVLRLEQRILPVIDSLGLVAKFIDDLMEIPYSIERLVDTGGAKEVYKVLGLYKGEKAERKKLAGKKIRDFDIDKIREYPKRFGGTLTNKVFNSTWRDNQSMFDFVNIFTEFAKTQTPRKRLATEEEAGKLANWIMENKRKFL